MHPCQPSRARHQHNRNTLLALSAALFLSACSPFLEATTPAGGIAIANGDQQGALNLAERHCAQSNKHARITQISMSEIAFDCVPM